MKSKHLLTYLLFMFGLTVVSTYDIFEGILQQSGACFPTHPTAGCRRSLVQSYTPRYQGAGQNPPATKAWLFTSRSPGTAEELHKCGGGLPPSTTFDPSQPTEIVVHGWLDGVCRTAWMRETKEQLFNRGNYNVILVDWTWGNTPDYATAAVNSMVVGEQVAFIIRNIVSQLSYDCKKFHVIGHSFGGVATGIVGKFTRNECKLGRITALDYALAPFQFESDTDLLNPDDAHFVDVIHTNAGECFPFSIGISRQLGHVDFYVNDGSHQPACVNYIVTSFLKLDILYGALSLVYPALCSHVMAVQYYKVSINAAREPSTQLVGVECDSYDNFVSGNCSRVCTAHPSSCLVMGMDTPLYVVPGDSKRRVYYVPTTNTCPYNDYTGFSGYP